MAWENTHFSDPDVFSSHVLYSGLGWEPFPSLPQKLEPTCKVNKEDWVSQWVSHSTEVVLRPWYLSVGFHHVAALCPCLSLRNHEAAFFLVLSFLLFIWFVLLQTHPDRLLFPLLFIHNYLLICNLSFIFSLSLSPFSLSLNMSFYPDPLYFSVICFLIQN